MKNANPVLKQTLKQFREELCNEFYQKANIGHLTRKLVKFIDQSLIGLFYKNKLHLSNQFCLVALGSYGRRELLLHSDIDLLLLHSEKLSKIEIQRAQSFIQECWDAGLNISHQITTVEACAQLAQKDLTVISSILDVHLLCGKSSLMEELQYKTHPLHMWPSEDYFLAKMQEQQTRYKKYGETEYNLEPNVKHGPGALRDLQMLLCIGKRHYGIKKLADGISCGFFTDKEYEELINCQHFLWRVRFALHAITGKQEERLLFDHQLKLATLFNFTDNSHSLGIEQFMKAYFTVIKRNRELNEMLFQWFSEAIVHHEKQRIQRLDNYFQLSNNFIEIRHTRVFIQHPQALISLFLWIAKKPDILGVRASTIRLIRQQLYLMNRRFKLTKSVTSAFMAIFREGMNPFEALQHMNRYGVLGHYLDCFAAVTGQMQYDLFHVYTVDQHTLYVIRNIVRFLNPFYSQKFPLAASVMSSIKKKEIIYLAAFFHDIAKGRGGDHSDLGALEANQFAINHNLDDDDRELLIWLVQNHLLMSQTAQRQDIYDPKTIQDFSSKLPSLHYLDYLYLLTVADICGTNPSLWNSWKDTLLKELYKASKQALLETSAFANESALIESRKQQALEILIADKILPARAQRIWENFQGIYFLHESPKIIAKHTKAILDCKEYPLVMILPHHSEGGTEVFIYMPHHDERFTITTTVLSNHHTTIQEATILSCKNEFDLDTYIILDEQHQALFDKEKTDLIQQALVEQLAKANEIPSISKRRITRTMAHFKLPPQISFSEENHLTHTRLFLIATDRPGLLAHVSRIFTRLGILLHGAKIATAGERVEDTFYVSSHSSNHLTLREKERLKELLMKELA
ncbi:[protein-PII] uridylyltransferase [Legionella sp. 16cNR16C]|uniref:[protein-PII] uridylyltransferase n=1 Tax=Legionella sp. 16cNR16C TaxID=2905656 RepID=UPI001E432BFF|nr:[protein-PII] uridylyltransferase [Legionella sp. 16cNR16C]MCE3044825.1 [protein-PII] uridylyltransferase [Legionella sp. 16cNR16C]